MSKQPGESEPHHSQSQMPPVLDFLHQVAKLKHLDRTGWVRNGIKKPETVAGHMYRMAIMSGFVIDDPTLDLNRCIKLSIIHDIGESIIGDITPHCGISEATKYDLESAAIHKLSKLIGQGKEEEIKQLFLEYEHGTTPEGRLVMDLDKFDMILQAYEYEVMEGKPKFLQAFFDSTKSFFEREHCHPKVMELVKQLNSAREQGIKFSVSL